MTRPVEGLPRRWWGGGRWSLAASALITAALATGSVMTSGSCSEPPEETVPLPNTGPLYRAFQDAGQEFGVPTDLLLAIAWVGTRWNPAPASDDIPADVEPNASATGPGMPTPDPGTEPPPDPSDDSTNSANNDPPVDGGSGGRRGLVGIMQLDPRPPLESLALAATLLDVSTDVLETDPKQNIRGAAAVLRHLAGQTYLEGHPLSPGEVPADSDEFRPLEVERLTLEQWRDVLAVWAATEDVELTLEYLDSVYRVLGTGVGARTVDGELIELVGRPEFVVEDTRPE